MSSEFEQLETRLEHKAKLLGGLRMERLTAAQLAGLQHAVAQEAQLIRDAKRNRQLTRWFGGASAFAACLMLAIAFVKPIVVTDARFTPVSDDLDMWVSAFEQSREQLTADLSGYSINLNDSYLDDWAEFDLYNDDEDSL